MSANNEGWTYAEEEYAQISKLLEKVPESYKKYVSLVKYDDGKISYEIDRHRMYMDVYEARCKILKEGKAVIESIDAATRTNSLLLS